MLKNHIYARRRQDYKVCMIRHFMSYRKKRKKYKSKMFTMRWLDDEMKTINNAEIK